MPDIHDQPFRGITVDPEGAADLDDAILVTREGDGWLVEVGVPDCSALVPPGSEADLAARAAGFTLYAGRGVRRRMLPKAVTDALSLTPGPGKRALVLSVALDRDLRPGMPAVASRAFESGGRLTYPEAARAISEPSHPHHAALALADRLASGLAARRAAGGAIGMRRVGDNLQTDEEGRLHVASGHPGERLVSELMVLANASVAALCAARGIPILFRNHQPLPAASLRVLSRDIDMAGTGQAEPGSVAFRLDHLLGRARLGPAAEGHWGLGLPAYLWFTSPIRRYADLVNQRVVLAHLAGGAVPDFGLDDLAAHLNALHEEAREDSASWHKERAAVAAEARIRAGNIKPADANAFTGMVKVATERGDLPDTLLDEALARIERGELSGKDTARLLGFSPKVATRVAEVLARCVHLAPAVANHLAQESGRPNATYEESVEGPPHMPTFTAVATVHVEGDRIVSRPAVARNAKEARHRAIVLALAEGYGAALPSWPEAGEAPAGPATASPAPAGAEAGTGNPKGAVQEFCQARRWPMPRYEVEGSGPSHAPTFTAVAAVRTPTGEVRSRPRVGTSRKVAEAEAARDLLGRL